MASGLQQSITIINNSGKVINTGKHIFGIFKEAKASYKEKKASIHHERSLQRARTFDASHQSHDPQYYEPYAEYEYGHNPQYEHDDARSHASHRSHRSHRSRRAGPALTEANLQSHSEVSATPPSARLQNYHSPYAETSPRDRNLSRPTLARAPTEGVLYEQPLYHEQFPMQRSASSPALQHMKKGRKKSIDMDLAYGNIPPDLASRTDLDPEDNAREARGLVGRIEGLLEEAQCAQHSAGATISHLQRNPEAAAAVALTLAELSTLLTQMSPAFLGVIKGGSPAVFALLASPQFLIAAGAAVGVTIVMFGGWKIIKRMREDKVMKAKEQAMAWQAMQMGPMPQGYQHPPQPYPYPQGVQDGFPGGVEHYRGLGDEGDADEALVIEQELSGIESWRRGISPFGENGEADTELISPEAQRAMKKERKERRRRRHHSEGEDDEPRPEDSVSQYGRSEVSHRSHRSHRSSRHHESGREQRERRDDVSEASSRRSSRSKRTVKTIEAKKDDGGLDLVFRTKEKEKGKAGNMLKTLFKKKKDKEERGRPVSVMV